MDNVNLWKKVLEIKDENGTWNESDLRQLYLNTTYQTNEVITSIHSAFGVLGNTQSLAVPSPVHVGPKYDCKLEKIAIERFACKS